MEVIYYFFDTPSLFSEHENKVADDFIDEAEFNMADLDQLPG